MPDDALIDWLTSGSKVSLSPEERRAKCASEFAARFTAALNPEDDLGTTEEAHQAAVASDVYQVHADLNALGEEAYSDVWRLLAAGPRAAIKRYVAMHKAA